MLTLEINLHITVNPLISSIYNGFVEFCDEYNHNTIMEPLRCNSLKKFQYE